MRAIRGRNTSPEIKVRRILHALGFRFRLHMVALPGRPDIVLPKHKLAVFVHGCFWHRHEECRYATTPKSNYAFWQKKFLDNVSRDKRVRAALSEAGWRTIVIWECCLRQPDSLAALSRVLPTKIRSDSSHFEIPSAAKSV
jgi:DNA mismatch endonuclease (patch repair protein)